MMKLQSQNTWFSRWFNEDYLKLYARRDEAKTHLGLQRRTIGLHLSPEPPRAIVFAQRS